MPKIDISNVIRVTLLAGLRGLPNVNTSALAIVTSDVPIPGDFGVSRVYLNAAGVADDFGSSSDTYRLAVAVFSQSPNIITGTGFLVVIPRLQNADAQPATILGSSPVDLTALKASNYTLQATVNGDPDASIEIGEIDATDLETAENSLNSTEITAAGLKFTLSGEITSAAVNLSTLATGSSASIVLSAGTYGTDIAPLLGIALKSATGSNAGLERAKDAVLRTNGAVEYFGIVLTEKLIDSDLTEFAGTVQTMDKLFFAGSNLSEDIAGVFSTIKDSGLTHTRCLYYSTSENDALDFAAGYASRGMSINFSGVNTAHTMHLKEVVGVPADPNLTQTQLDAAKNAGVDVYADFGVPKVFTSGANQFFDQVYTRTAFKLRLQIAGFNLLAQVQTKLPQTSAGMDALRGAYRQVCAQFVANGTFGPGTWNSPTTFGDPEDFIRNIADVGYFVYSLPITQQSQTEREARVAPVVQIAAKDAGAIHSSDVLVFVEA